jgi:hypothetical protein
MDLPSEALLKPAEVARLLGTTVGVLAKWRCTEDPPRLPFVRVTPRMIRYRARDLEQLLRERTVSGPAGIR